MQLKKNKNLNYIQIKINEKTYSFPKDYTILQACEYIGLEIPRFCYHKELLIAGNCRMCLVELEKSPKPVASCAMQIMPNMSIYTDTPLVRKAREGVLEFLLLNHPLDCPICDQGGECDLQDQSLLYGTDRSRFYEFKRSVEDKNCGPLIKTIMTRCIHCTRCIRFIDEVAGTPILGTTNRGKHTEVGSYINKSIKSELSGNLIDLCPVGALTSKAYAFKARSWELKNKPSVDVFDSLGSNLIANIRGASLLRILPAYNAEINNEWISDKVRFSFDSISIQRLKSPLIKSKNMKFENCSWKEIIGKIKTQLNHVAPNKILSVSGKIMNLENHFMLKKELTQFGILDYTSETLNTNNNDFIDNIIFKNSLTDFKDNDLCFIVGSHLKHEAPILNSQLRKRYLAGNFNIYNLGANSETNMPITNVGLELNDLIKIIEGRHTFSKILLSAKNPIIIISTNLFNQTDSKTLTHLLNNFKSKLQATFSNFDNFNYLHNYANDVGMINLGYKNYNTLDTSKKEILFLLNTDQFIQDKQIDTANKTIIYIGSHITSDALNADMILPCFSFMEEPGIYMNTEGRAQFIEHLIKMENLNNRSIWSILQIIFSKINLISTKNIRKELLNNYPLNFNKKYNSMFKLNSNVVQKTMVQKSLNKPFTSFIENFYLNDPISKNSPIMGKTSFMLRQKKNFLEKK